MDLQTRAVPAGVVVFHFCFNKRFNLTEHIKLKNKMNLQLVGIFVLRPLIEDSFSESGHGVCYHSLQSICSTLYFEEDFTDG
ncbi:hypothetical protein [Amphibacillus cookii]|uniref:hypothetical protein n=1 Tax=Amphibacillus cookii TaxID=767787 RepID=UPI00195BA165|nr:hypothetical protein [Amphibacillus cookii]MBM7539868.1 hypothetical protein [Amphibacillus cookii]